MTKIEKLCRALHDAAPGMVTERMLSAYSTIPMGQFSSYISALRAHGAIIARCEGLGWVMRQSPAPSHLKLNMRQKVARFMTPASL
jgi:hypothetical protein